MAIFSVCEKIALGADLRFSGLWRFKILKNLKRNLKFGRDRPGPPPGERGPARILVRAWPLRARAIGHGGGGAFGLIYPQFHEFFVHTVNGEWDLEPSELQTLHEME